MKQRSLWLSKETHMELVRLSIPTVISTLAVPLLGLVDTAVLGRLPDVTQLAGAAAAGVILNVVFWMFGFLRMGTTGLVAQVWGRGNEKAATQILVQSVVIALGLGILLVALKSLISWIGFASVGAPPDVTGLGKTYFGIRIFEAPFFLVTLAITGFMRGQGDVMVPMYTVIVVNIINIVGDLILVPGTFGLPSFGVVGAAAASLVAQSAGCLLLVAICLRRIRGSFEPNWLKGWRTFAWYRFFQVQTHLFFRTLALVLTLAAVTSLVARLGSAHILAAHAILMQLWSLVSYAVDGFAYATETTVGTWLGKGDLARAQGSARAALLWGITTSILFGLIYLLSVEQIAAVFTRDPQVAAVVKGLVWAVAVSQPVNALAYIYDGILIGATDTRYLRDAMLLSSIVFCGIIAVGWLVSGLSLGLVWWALVGFMGMRAATLGWRFRSNAWYEAVMKG